MKGGNRKGKKNKPSLAAVSVSGPDHSKGGRQPVVRFSCLVMMRLDIKRQIPTNGVGPASECG
jgi:hypothetical protein